MIYKNATFIEFDYLRRATVVTVSRWPRWLGRKLGFKQYDVQYTLYNFRWYKLPGFTPVWGWTERWLDRHIDKSEFAKYHNT